MPPIERRVNKTETLVLLPCPFCGGDIQVKDCGYSTFNPGRARCRGTCKREWKLGWVDNQWDAGKIWNAKQPNARRIEELRNELKRLGEE